MQQALAQLRQLLRPHPGWYGVFAALMLTGIGIAAIGTVEPGFAGAQAQRWLPVALVVMGICVLPHPRVIGFATYPMLAVSLALLLFVLLPFIPRSIVPVINGARSWINLGLMNFQPSEVTKAAFVLALARYLRYRDNYRTLRGLLVPFLIMFVPVVLILKEPDLGTALLFAPTLFVVLVAAGAKLRHLFSLLAVGVVVIGANVAIIAFEAPQWMHVLKPHQEARIASMIHPEKHRNREGYQQQIAMTILGAGGVNGMGAQRSHTILRFNHLPEDHNDMIFPVIVNRWGLVGAGVVLALYLVLIGSFILIAARSKDPFARLACVGFAGMIFTQATINIAMTVGLLPITGITLPFVSYGGSSLVATYAMLGLVLNFASRRPAMLSRPSFEFDSPSAVSS